MTEYLEKHDELSLVKDKLKLPSAGSSMPEQKTAPRARESATLLKIQIPRIYPILQCIQGFLRKLYVRTLQLVAGGKNA